ncbi:MAG: cysteine--1-D-myo-inosityl 2-amino-2-deoxy-alpha-D-glucopyranoside ligase [Actinobacteria bacterium]|nr:cysteine--1-D-myo-inosityl 2-amino-2-deoxy-alpha-D-glucopyranoside ligase [Actinomycetota bacterium]
MNSWAEVYLPPIDKVFAFPTFCLKNSATGLVESLHVKDTYRMYVCGITPYDATHLGHAATYVTFDLINRYLRASGKNVLFVENITDIDDPLLERATRDGIDWKDLAQSQIELFRGDMSDLHVIPPNHYIGAVESINLVVDAISTLKSKGYVYEVGKDLYFSVRADSEFGSRSHLRQDRMIEIFSQRGGDPAIPGKRDPLDALVWLSHRPGEPYWPSPFGDGRPGWHIECSAIALNYLNVDPEDDFSIDIQGGGSDLLFPHHEMGASESALLSGQQYARMYVYAGMIGLDGEKMSKSLGNLVFLSRLVNDGFDPMAIRLALISDHYSTDRMWSDTKLIAGVELLDRLRIALSKPEVAPTELVIEGIIQALSNDLDTPRALSLLTSWCDETFNGGVGGSAGELARAIDLLLGVAI